MGSLFSYFESEPVVKQTFVPVYVPQYRPIEAEKQSVVTTQTVAEKIKNDPHKHLRRPQKTRRTRRPTVPSQQHIQKLANDAIPDVTNVKLPELPKFSFDFSKFKI